MMDEKNRAPIEVIATRCVTPFHPNSDRQYLDINCFSRPQPLVAVTAITSLGHNLLAGVTASDLLYWRRTTLYSLDGCGKAKMERRHA